jgi:hypothetical protein
MIVSGVTAALKIFHINVEIAGNAVISAAAKAFL